MKITNHLISNKGFSKLSKSEELDFNLFTCLKRIHILHYLFYSEEHKHFSIAIRYDEPKGLAGGGKKMWNHITLPKVINSIEDAEELVNMFKNSL